MSEKAKVTIIGAGVIGCSIAYRLSAKFKDIFVIEKNGRIKAENQSSRNSGVIHAGIYYPKDLGKYKGQLCVEGNGLLYDFCEEFNIPHRKVGKLVVAVDERELPYLDETFRIAQDNEVPDIRMLNATEVRRREPNVRCLRGIYVPTSGIVEATALVYQLYCQAIQAGAFFVFGTEVMQVQRGSDCFEVSTMSMGREETIESEFVINAAGLHSDIIARMIDPDFPHTILPLRGEAAKFNKRKRPDLHHSGMNVYPVPSIFYHTGERATLPYDEYRNLFEAGQVLKTVGVHLTPTFDIVNGQYDIGDTVTIGPAAKGVADRDDYSKDLFPETHFLTEISPIFPNLKLEDISLHQAGIQAKLRGRYDWVIERDVKHPNCIHLVGIDSPGLTACLAIADQVGQMISDNLS